MKDPDILADEEAGRAFLSTYGAFLANGKASGDPESGKYQLEISLLIWTTPYDQLSLSSSNFYWMPQVIERKKGCSYLSPACRGHHGDLIVISQCRRVIILSVKILRETRNDLNWANNAETANIARTVSKIRHEARRPSIILQNQR